MAKFSAVYDACVLYPAPLRDLLLQLAMADLFHAHWTKDIHAEWMRSVADNRPDLTAGQLERTRELMDAHVSDSLVEGYEHLISSIHLPDEEDRHVLAAAIASGSDVIVTYNLKDFPSGYLETYGLEAWHPDRFVTHWIEIAPAVVCAAASAIRTRLRKPPKSVDEYIDIIEHQRLPQTADALRGFRRLL